METKRKKLSYVCRMVEIFHIWLKALLDIPLLITSWIKPEKLFLSTKVGFSQLKWKIKLETKRNETKLFRRHISYQIIIAFSSKNLWIRCMCLFLFMFRFRTWNKCKQSKSTNLDVTFSLYEKNKYFLSWQNMSTRFAIHNTENEHHLLVDWWCRKMKA